MKAADIDAEKVPLAPAPLFFTNTTVHCWYWYSECEAKNLFKSMSITRWNLIWGGLSFRSRNKKTFGFIKILKFHTNSIAATHYQTWCYSSFWWHCPWWSLLQFLMVLALLVAAPVIPWRTILRCCRMSWRCRAAVLILTALQVIELCTMSYACIILWEVLYYICRSS